MTKRSTPVNNNTNSATHHNSPQSTLPTNRNHQSSSSSSVTSHFTSSDHSTNNGSNGNHYQQHQMISPPFDLNQINDDLTNPYSHLLTSVAVKSEPSTADEEIDAKFSPSNLLENILAEEDNSLYFPMDDDDPNQIDFLINSNLYSAHKNNSSSSRNDNAFTSSINDNCLNVNHLQNSNNNIQILPSSPLFRNSNNYYNDDNNNVLLNIDFKHFNPSVGSFLVI